MKNNHGITLVSVLITVVVLVILAGVTITIGLGNNGLLGTTKNTVDKYEESFGEEESAWDRLSSFVAKGGRSTNKEATDYNPSYRSRHPEEYIPSGFTYLEGTVDTGYVIKDSIGNEFVWIPVETPVANSETELNTLISQGKYPMAVKTSGTDANGLDNYRGVLYDFSLNGTGDGVAVTAKSYNASSGFREPANLTGTDTDTGYVYDSQEMFTYQNAGQWYETMYQEEYNNLVASVKQNGGFWIGRYESGNLNTNTAVSKKGASGINNVNWYQMYKAQKNIYGNTSKNKTHMVWGSQFDQVLIYLKDVPNVPAETNKFFVLDSTDMGVYSNNRSSYWDNETTKTTGKFNVRGIYDIAGNAWDRTMETYSTNHRTIRGRYF